LAVSPVRNELGGAQYQLPMTGSTAPPESARSGAFVRNDRFDRSAERPETEPVVVRDRELHSQLKEIAERRDAAGDGPGMLPPASMFVPLPEAWTPSGLNSEG
jgi:hypothetical protein